MMLTQSNLFIYTNWSISMVNKCSVLNSAPCIFLRRVYNAREDTFSHYWQMDGLTNLTYSTCSTISTILVRKINNQIFFLNMDHQFHHLFVKNLRFFLSLMGFFCLGLSGYHGIQGLYHPNTEIQSLPLALGILGARNIFILTL